jgi:hypothetical protein
MTIKASGRWALIIAAGIWAGLAGPLQAAEGEGADNAIPSVPSVSSQAAKATGAPIVLKKYTKSRHAQRKSSKAALKSTNDKKATEADAADNSGDRSTAIAPAVANANAQLPAADTPIGNAKAMSARANNILAAAADSPADAQPAADAQVVAADQLNDLDRALQESKPVLQEDKPPAATLAMVSANAPVAPVMARSDDNSTWDQTSLIGKIFIAFGALLTMASAARMFMA